MARLKGKTMPKRFYDLREVSKKGNTITSIEDLLKEDNVYYHRSFVPVEFLKTWKFGCVLAALECGSFSYAISDISNED